MQVGGARCQAHLIFLFVAVATLLLGGGLAPAQFRGDDDPEAPRYGWLSSLSSGKERARAERKPLMVVIRCVP
jgi:hypothetical protein